MIRTGVSNSSNQKSDEGFCVKCYRDRLYTNFFMFETLQQPVFRTIAFLLAPPDSSFFLRFGIFENNTGFVQLPVLFLVVVSRGTLCSGARPSHCGGFSCC